MWFIGVEVEQETSAPPPKKNPGSAPVVEGKINQLHLLMTCSRLLIQLGNENTNIGLHNLPIQIMYFF